MRHCCIKGCQSSVRLSA